jgi:hypothetical protein
MKINVMKPVLVVLLLAAVASLQAKTVVREFNVALFSELEITGVGNVYLSQGIKESVKVEADDQRISDVIVERTGNKLTITTQGKKKWNSRVDVYVTVASFTSLNAKGVGNVSSKGQLLSPNLKLTVTAAGNVDLDLGCRSLTANFNATGHVKLTGKSVSAMLSFSGTGHIDTASLAVDTLGINAKGTGNISVYAGKDLTLDAGGTGSINYKGHPVVHQLSTHGTGPVHAED